MGTHSASAINTLPTTSGYASIAQRSKLPVAPGIVSGALFAFITSFDQVVLVLFLAGAEQRTVTIQMWGGIRENISPTILAVATLLVLISVSLLVSMELLRRRGERLRGIRKT